MATDYGTDIACTTDLPARFARVSGAQNLGQALARRLSTPRGSLAAIDPDPKALDYGFDLRAALNSASTNAGKNLLEQQIQRECEKDERIAHTDVTTSYSFATQTLTVSILLTPSDGSQPFPLVLAVTSLTVTILQGG